MEIRLMDVTPHLASEMLQKNGSNRRLRAGHVNSLAAMMREGKFQTTHQGVAINTEGAVVDGQHRLMAIVKSGVTIRMPVAFDVNAEHYGHLMIDVGMNRTTSDIYAVDRFVSQPCTFIAYMHRSDRHKAILEPYLEAFGPIIMAISRGARHMRRGVTSSPVVAAAAIRVAMGEDPVLVHEVFAGMVRLDYDSLPPVAKSYLRQLANKRVDMANKWDQFTRGMRVFDKSASENTKIQVKDHTSIIQPARDFVGAFIESPGLIQAVHDKLKPLSDEHLSRH